MPGTPDQATPKQLNHGKITGDGYGIPWPDLDEDHSTGGFLGRGTSTATSGNPLTHPRFPADRV